MDFCSTLLYYLPVYLCSSLPRRCSVPCFLSYTS